MSVKVKPNDKQDFKPFTIEMVEITWKKRCELNDLMIDLNNEKVGKIPKFSWWGEIVLKYTTMKETELNKYSTDEIIAIANAIFETANSKKK